MYQLLKQYESSQMVKSCTITFYGYDVTHYNAHTMWHLQTAVAMDHNQCITYHILNDKQQTLIAATIVIVTDYQNTIHHDILCKVTYSSGEMIWHDKMDHVKGT